MWSVVAAAVLAGLGCATSGAGTNPPLPGGEDGSDDGGAASDATQGDGPSTDDADDAAPATGGTCGNDLVHGARALFAIPPVPCTTNADCPVKDCCFVGMTSNTCVMQ
jgi:hypothetical protein